MNHLNGCLLVNRVVALYHSTPALHVGRMIFGCVHGRQGVSRYYGKRDRLIYLSAENGYTKIRSMPIRLTAWIDVYATVTDLVKLSLPGYWWLLKVWPFLSHLLQAVICIHFFPWSMTTVCMVEGGGSERKEEEGRREWGGGGGMRRGGERGGEGGGKVEWGGKRSSDNKCTRGRSYKVVRFCITGLYSGILKYTVYLL